MPRPDAPPRLAVAAAADLARRSGITRRHVNRLLARARPVRMGSLRRLEPITRDYGFSRGTPVDRVYIDRFLSRFAAAAGDGRGAVQGRVLEIGGRDYTDRYGVTGRGRGPGLVEHVDVFHVSAADPDATITGDLADPASLPEAAYDCIICTQTLHLIYDHGSVLTTLHRGLRPGGTLLLTVPGITPACTPERDLWGDWWRFTSQSLRRLLEERFEPSDVEVEAYGNVLSATAFLYGLAAEDLRPAELEARDPDFEVLVAARAVRSGAR